jgi:ribosomal protein S18 acetylase RimI-like enzyme
LEITNLQFQVFENPSSDEIDPISIPLKKYNESQIGKYRKHDFLIYALDESTEIIKGGIYGIIKFGWLHIDYLWVHEQSRKSGIGSKLMMQMESLGRELGIKNFKLNTGSFQAPDFYKKNGYEIFAQLEIIAPNGEKYWDYYMKKSHL